MLSGSATSRRKCRCPIRRRRHGQRHLNPGTLQQSVTVEAAPPAVEFNTANQELTIDTKMANDTPRLDRNPFKLTLLEPAAVNTRGEMQPFNSWAPNSVDLGGGTNLRNNLLVDGSPIGIGHKAGYPPNQDDVQETIVSQNSVDAESGHSAGGLISVTTKGGHQRLAWKCVLPGTLSLAERRGGPHEIQSERASARICTAERWEIRSSRTSSSTSFRSRTGRLPHPQLLVTVPTALERQGNFSQS